ncbi:OmpA/MotB family protein [Kineosporia succinea]|uniref:Chemotaxis protein MotB n=1 Tax=Kineosporia succinea TaxID=84632 RepID=A0ABT9PDD4_9ACTN|nr:flagellar motor protein MotB [Kineosporia succinea]MDP9830710.1 chemotaxis protein MotB [Kineosporia succinea]
MSSGRARRGHEEEAEEHENHERWMISYADMMTLLVALFIVLWAISQVDVVKFQALKTGLASGFGSPTTIMPGGSGLLDPGGSVAPDSLNLSGSAGVQRENPNAVTTGVAPLDAEKVAELVNATERSQVLEEVKNLQRAQLKLRNALVKAGMRNGASLRIDERGLVVTIATDNVLFASGSAELMPRGEKILKALGPTLRGLPNRLSIEGHTNSIPINTAQYPSNWELSGARASNVLRYLKREDAIPFKRMGFAGFADTQPRLAASDPRALVVNRRVEIVVLARVDDSSGRAVQELGSTDQTSSSSSGTASPSSGTAGSATSTSTSTSSDASTDASTTRVKPSPDVVNPHVITP